MNSDIILPLSITGNIILVERICLNFETDNVESIYSFGYILSLYPELKKFQTIRDFIGIVERNLGIGSIESLILIHVFGRNFDEKEKFFDEFKSKNVFPSIYFHTEAHINGCRNFWFDHYFAPNNCWRSLSLNDEFICKNEVKGRVKICKKLLLSLETRADGHQFKTYSIINSLIFTAHSALSHIYNYLNINGKKRQYLFELRAYVCLEFSIDEFKEKVTVFNGETNIEMLIYYAIGRLFMKYFGPDGISKIYSLHSVEFHFRPNI